MKPLRERGIYVAPNGRHLVASLSRQTTSSGDRILSRICNELSCFLFDRYQWAFHGAPDYEVSTSGEMFARTQAVSYRIEELIDTGATAGAH